MTGYMAEMRKLVGHRTIIQCAASVICIDRNGDEVSNFEIIYLCRKWHGEPKAVDGEMEELRFFSPEEINIAEISPPIRAVMEKYIGMVS